jgi:hypothetical protein
LRIWPKPGKKERPHRWNRPLGCMISSADNRNSSLERRKGFFCYFFPLHQTAQTRKVFVRMAFSEEELANYRNWMSTHIHKAVSSVNSIRW